MPTPDGVEAAHFVDSDDCQENPERYWRCWGWYKNVPVACGVGATAEQATQMAAEKLNEYKEKWDKSPQEQLRLLLGQERLLHNDLEKAVRLIGKIILHA